MKNKKMCAVISSVLATLVMLICSGITVCSASADCSVILHYALSGTRFELYRIGELTDGGVRLLEPFDRYHVDLDDYDAAYTISAYIELDNVKPDAEAVTNERGYADFDGLEKGVYFLTGSSDCYDGAYYFIMPSIFSLSDENGGHEELEVKYGISMSADFYMLNCLKIWEDGFDKHAQVNACLLCDGEVYERFVLNEENNWTYSWYYLDPYHDWMVAEDPVPEGYNVSISRDDYTFTIVNKPVPKVGGVFPSQPVTEPTVSVTQAAEATVPETRAVGTSVSETTASKPSSTSSKIPQTGQLNWPIAALAVLGVVLCLTGVLMLRRKHDEEE